MAAVRNGSGAKIRGSFKPFDIKEIREPRDRIIRSKSVIIPNTVSLLRDVCKMAIAARWIIAVEDIETVENVKIESIGGDIKEKIIEFVKEKKVDYAGTVECILDYYTGEQKIAIQLDRSAITYNAKTSPKIAARAVNDCLKLDSQCVKKVKEKIESCEWPEAEKNEQQHLICQYKTLSEGIAFINYFMKAFYTGNLNDISKEVFQEACKIDSQIQQYFHPKKDNPNIYKPKGKGKKLYRSIPNKVAVAYLICKAVSF